MPVELPNSGAMIIWEAAPGELGRLIELVPPRGRRAALGAGLGRSIFPVTRVFKQEANGLAGREECLPGDVSLDRALM